MLCSHPVGCKQECSFGTSTVKSFGKNTAPQSASCYCRDTVCQIREANSLGSSPSPRTMTCSHKAICSPGLPFNGLHPHNPCNYTWPFTDPWRMEGWVGWPIEESLPTKWLPVNQAQMQGRESLPAQDWDPNNWATLPTDITQETLSLRVWKWH